MNVSVLAWANMQCSDWKYSLKRLRSGLSGTFEFRQRKRVDTTVETIADLSRRLRGLESMIAQDEQDRGFNSQNELQSAGRR
jgi:hypothetical protein